MNLFTVDHLTKIYINKTIGGFLHHYERNISEGIHFVMKSISFQIEASSVTAITGKTGCGKTTLLRILSGFDKEYIGDVFYGEEGERIENVPREKIAYIPQEPELISYLNLYENILTGCTEYKKKKKAEIDAKIQKLADYFRISHILLRKPENISARERKICAFIRALVKNPDVFIIDEPTSFLDQEYTKMIIKIFTDLKETGKTIIMATDDPNLTALADSILFLENTSITREKQYAITQISDL